MRPEEKMKNLSGSVIGLFLIAVGIVLIGLDEGLIVWFQRKIVAGKSCGFVLIILGLSTLILTPHKVKLGDFLGSPLIFYRKAWEHSNLLIKISWLAIAAFSIFTFIYFW